MSDPLLTLVPPREPRRPLVGIGAVLAALVVGALALGVVGIVEATSRPPAPDDALLTAPVPTDLAAAVPDTPVAAAAVPVPVPPPVVKGVAAPATLGRAAGLELAVPGVDPVVVSYHEASYGEAVPIAPAGVVAGNDNPTRGFDRLDVAGPEYHVQVSRGRRPGPTTAVDVVLADGEEVLSPVAGRVAEVRPYQLYGRHEDVRIELVPDDRPDLRVVLIHVHGVAVRTGDRVAVGDVLASGARLFPFEAVVDRATALERHGHVHLEVKRPDDERG